MGHQVDRLAAHLRSTPGAERSIAGRVGGALWFIAALATAALPLFPQVDTPFYPWPLVWTVGALVWSACALFVVDWRQAPAWLLPAASVAAVIVIAAVTDLTGGADSPARLYVFFALAYAACFLSPWQAAGITVACGLVWAFPVLGDRGAASAAGELAMALPTFAVVGAVLQTGRHLLTAMHHAADRLSEEHHALRSIATAVAAGRTPDVVCSLAAEQAARLLGAQGGGILRFDADDHLTVVGTWEGDRAPVMPGTRFPVVAASPMASIRRDGRAQRIDDIAGEVHQSQLLLDLGFQAWAGAPIHVRGRLWGALAVTAVEAHSLPVDAVEHLVEFAELVGMAVANTEEVARLSADATTDPLTGLANHRAFQERLRTELGRAQRHERPMSLALVDIDHFKAINDAGGHGVGDEVLRTLATHLREHFRGEDVLARIGGDEFAVLLPEVGGEEAVAALERARRAIERSPFAGGARVTISVGVCDAGHSDEAEALTRFADGALYWSKEHGRNRVSTYDPLTIHELSAVERLQQLQRSQALVGIRALARAIDARDPSTSEHSERVAKLAARLAEQRNWTPERVALLHEAALVHDVGKIGIPDAILLKPARLTREEYAVIQGHAELSARIVEEVLDAEQVDWILSHHERPDGCGYPRGLRGAELTEGAALLAAADAFDVMVSARPYSPGRSIDEALSECHALIGEQFTPAAVAALEGLYGPADALRFAA
ncbi:MAG TPA: diguanylate cyclase [Baekduia sp.]|uniref:sensor domain-containing diguanylate cyclase/phosphohydrolase n=1 Tax=Baekduia sp. TaxID=2600305 RepID=UPI002CB16D51|nr:diguanylate cyclase [Baekduia sp.]HMJ34200.1 diguanylate cyclase [Baekduia sp.]